MYYLRLQTCIQLNRSLYLKMESVELGPLQHRNAECIGIYFTINNGLQSIIQKEAKGKWSQTHRCWYVECTERNYQQLAKALQGKAVLETAELKKYLLERKKNGYVGKVHVSLPVIPDAKQEIKRMPAQKTTAFKLSNENTKALQKFRQTLILKSYSPSTIRTYTNEFMQFLQTIKDRSVNEFSASRLKDYLQYCHTTLHLSENTLHSRINAMKFYYEQVLKREKFFWEIPRPKKPLILPKVLGEDELRKLFNAITFKKHKAILFTAYSAGLRVSEVVNLQLKHIDRSRMQLFIEKSKGKKDRYVGLSVVLLDILENYYKEAKPKPVKYLFEGQQKGIAYHARSAQKVFQMAKEKAGINKEIGFHSLRHSFATHLLEKGIDIKYIKDLLGHFDIHTTERYLHVKREKLISIISPLDDLWQKEGIEW